MKKFEPEISSEEWDEAELLKNEKDALGFYITGHPLTKYRGKLSALNIKKTSEIGSMSDREDVQIAGVIAAIKKFQKKGTADTMAYLTIEDEEGSVEAIAFTDIYRNSLGLLKKDTLVTVKGTIDKTEKGIKLLLREISGIDGMASKNGLKCEISIKYPIADSLTLENIREALSGSSGNALYI